MGSERSRKGLGFLARLVLAACVLGSAPASHAQPAGASIQAIDPPERVARVAWVEGPVALRSGGVQTSAELNRPVTDGDRLELGPGARLELQVGTQTWRVGGPARLEIGVLDQANARVAMSSGTLSLRIRESVPGDRIEVDTPNLSLLIDRDGTYRIDADPASDATTLTVRAGGGIVEGDGGLRQALDAPRQVVYTGNLLRVVAAHDPGTPDAHDAWVAERDRLEDQSVAAAYVGRDMVGYQALDAYGTWQQTPEYGAVWVPTAMAPGWAPYQDGRWLWVLPWGWTWVDRAPWGFAPFHYGRWSRYRDAWAWIPGRGPSRPVYSPALVGFAPHDRVGFGPGSPPRHGSWRALGPGDVYRPFYRASPLHVGRVNGFGAVPPAVHAPALPRPYAGAVPGGPGLRPAMPVPPPGGHVAPPHGYAVPPHGPAVPPPSHLYPPRAVVPPPRAYAVPPHGYAPPPRAYAVPPHPYASPPRGFASPPRAPVPPPRVLATPPRAGAPMGHAPAMPRMQAPPSRSAPPGGAGHPRHGSR